jgi:hypothetical protein
MHNKLYSVSEVIEKVKAGKILSLAGDESLLAQIPKGKWIGGTIPYFMSENGGIITKDKIFVTELPDYISEVSIKKYDESDIKNVYKDGQDFGFSIIIIPASGKVHLSFALNAPHYEGFATRPLIGWISGVHLNDLGKINPAVFIGQTKEKFEDVAVVLHAKLPKNKIAEISIINIFSQSDSDTIKFTENSFSAKDAIVNDKLINFAEYVTSKKIDTRLPLVANYSGAMINISFQSVDNDKKIVNFYAPVFKDIEYKLAAPVKDYINSFLSHMPETGKDNIMFSCNCILNFLYSELEGKTTGGITGPITFGEIAYQLLNQTMANIIITDI